MRIPLRNIGPSTPEFVVDMLGLFGKNPHGEPQYRLIWSQRKMIWFNGEVCPEYEYLNPPAWVLETWTPPEKDAGPPEKWEATTFGLLGPYPREGTYNFVREYPSDWYPNEDAIRLLCEGLKASQRIPFFARVKAIRANKEAEAAAARGKVAEEIVELQDSASRGKSQQAVSGAKNNFRTPEDFDRDRWKREKADLPLSGGKLLRGDNT